MPADPLSEFLRKESDNLQVSSDKLEAKANELSPLVGPSADDLKTTHLVVAVHGIGKQYRYSTIQGVTTRFASYCKSPITKPLGAFHPDKLIDFSKSVPKFEHSLWALVLAFLYLWWLAALLFDLVYIWHRYIYYGRSGNEILSDLHKSRKIAAAS